jgi:DNA replication and repair protein RecF
MHIRRIKLENFRNYEKLLLEPCQGVNVLMGENAQGKTNALEAVYLTCAGRSHRTRQDRELIKWGADFASVGVDALRSDGSHQVDIIIPAAGKRIIKIAGQKAARSGELMGHVTGVIFSPEDLGLIKDGPAERRRFMDIAISQLRPAYYYALQRYSRALRQRGEILRTQFYAALDEFDMELARSGSEIMRHRKWYVSKLNQVARDVHGHISMSREELSVEYRPNGGEDMLESLRAARETDMRRMTTSVGAHRDDLALFIDGHDARLYGSQGQQRTAALSLRLSELTVMRDEAGEWPVLMLDDVMSELDPVRRRQLVKYLGGVQVLITCTDPDDLAGAEIGAMFRVSGAKISRE